MRAHQRLQLIVSNVDLDILGIEDTATRLLNLELDDDVWTAHTVTPIADPVEFARRFDPTVPLLFSDSEEAMRFQRRMHPVATPFDPSLVFTLADLAGDPDILSSGIPMSSALATDAADDDRPQAANTTSTSPSLRRAVLALTALINALDTELRTATERSRITELGGPISESVVLEECRTAAAALARAREAAAAGPAAARLCGPLDDVLAAIGRLPTRGVAFVAHPGNHPFR